MCDMTEEEFTEYLLWVESSEAAASLRVRRVRSRAGRTPENLSAAPPAAVEVAT